MRLNTYIRSLLAILLLLAAWNVQSKEIPDPKSPPQFVNDYIKLLSDGEKRTLERKLFAYSDSTSTEIAIVIIQSLEGDEVGRFATELAHDWGIGQKDKQNGCVILVSMDERKISIQNGYGLEAYLTDATSRLIIENEISPAFKQGEYYRGLDQATSAIIQTLAGTYEGRANRDKGVNGRSVIFIIIIILVLLSFLRNRGGGSGNRGGGGGWIFFPMGGFGGGHTYGGGGFGGGGGGFGGFGGGGFGGGGASGGW